MAYICSNAAASNGVLPIIQLWTLRKVSTTSALPGATGVPAAGRRIGKLAVRTVGISRGLRRDELAQAGQAALGRGADVGAAALREIGHEDFGIPAAAGPDLDDGVARPHAEEGERLDRVAIAVARDVGGGARRRGGGEAQRGLVEDGGRLDRGAGGEERRSGKEASEESGPGSHVILPDMWRGDHDCWPAPAQVVPRPECS